jgi:hypothetical protein
MVARVSPPGPDCEDRRNQGLEDEADMQRTAIASDQFLLAARQHFFHAVGLSGVTTF